MEADQSQDGRPHSGVGSPPYQNGQQHGEEQTVPSRLMRCEIGRLTPQDSDAVEIRQKTGQHDEDAIFP